MSASYIITARVDSSSGDITRLLRRLADGDPSAREELAPQVYRELHKLAAFYLRRERSSHTWQTTELLNEAYLRLIGETEPDFRGRSHFFGVAAQIMRRILTDHARSRRAQKRGGNALTVPLHDGFAISDEQAALFADLDEALQRLEAIHPQAAKVVELRFFGGLTEEESAVVMGISSRTVKRLWVTARAWLFGQLNTDSR